MVQAAIVNAVVAAHPAYGVNAWRELIGEAVAE